MVNAIILMGRLGADPITGSYDGGTYSNFSLCVQRDYKNSKGEYDVDWIDVVTFGANADFAKKYLHKGMKILVIGRLQNDNYIQNGETIYKNKVVAYKIEFCESKKEDNKITNSVMGKQLNTSSEKENVMQEDNPDDPLGVGINQIEVFPSFEELFK